MNAARLSIELLCRGVRLDAAADGRSVVQVLHRTRAGLGSGLEVQIPGRRKTHYVNVPVEEPFARESPWTLVPANGPDAFHVLRAETGERYEVHVPPDPAWYDRPAPSGGRLHEVGVLQGTYLGIYVGPVCAFWSGKGDAACGFCTTGRNVGEHENRQKSVEDVVAAARAAKHESGVTFVHLNTGYQGPNTVRLVEPYVRALKEDVGVLVGVQSTPSRDLTDYDRLHALGVDHLSFCYEFHDPAFLARYCSGKTRAIGLETYKHTLTHCSELFGRGSCSGEIIAGVEPIATTLRAIDWIASVGAFPTVCVFRPTQGSHMESIAPPDPDAMEVVYRGVWDACRRHHVPVGLAPNIEVSLVLTPDDCADLDEAPGFGDRFWRATLAVGRVAAGPGFRRRMRARPRPDLPDPEPTAPGRRTP